MPPVRRSMATRRLILAGAIACAAACRAATPPTTQAPAPSPAPEAPVRAEPPRERGPEEVVVVVDGVAIREADVDRLMRVARTDPKASPRREVVVLQLVERRLIAREAEAQGIAVTQEEIDRAVRMVASAQMLTMEQLRTAVDEATELSWEEYREEVVVQILEMKLLMIALPRTAGMDWGVPAASWDDERISTPRARMLGCLRARANVSVEDASVELPDNPFGIAATLAGVRFVGDPGLPAVEVEAAAKAAAVGRPLCDSVIAAELAMTEIYLERGYLDASVRIAWPKTPGTTIVDVEAWPGPRNVIGAIDVDQSAVPRAKRVSDKALRRKLAAVGKTGDVASLSRLQGVAEVVHSVFRDAGVGPVGMTVSRKAATPGAEEKRVDLLFRVGENEA